MNRRQFTQRLGAIAAAPCLPIGISASPATATSVSQTYHWAAFIARIHDKASPKMLQRHLDLSNDAATQIYQSLVRDGIVSAPDATGVSHAMNPFKRSFKTNLAAAPQAAFEAKLKAKVKQVKETLDRVEKIQDNFDDVDAKNNSDE